MHHLNFIERFVLHLCNYLNFNRKVVRRFKIILLRTIGFTIADDIFIDRGFDFYNPRNITISKYVSLGHFNRLWAFDKIIIGDYVQTAIGLTIVSGSHNISDYEPLPNQKVVIEGENWIGANVTIIGGVTIGRGAIIAAGAVVTKNIPPYTIAGGVPAKVLKERIPAKQVLSPFGYYKPFFYNENDSKN